MYARPVSTARTVSLLGMRFSSFEKREIAKAWIILSLAFAILFERNFFSFTFLVAFILSFLTVGVGFLLHELGHKFVAQRYGLWAEFRAYNQGLLLALVMSFFGFIFAAPGAVVVHGHTSVSRMGKIAAAGPLVNYVLTLLFLVLGFFNPFSLLSLLFYYGAAINAFLGLFNMIPFSMFDGKKIIAWDKKKYWLMVIAGFILLGVSWSGF